MDDYTDDTHRLRRFKIQITQIDII